MAKFHHKKHLMMGNSKTLPEDPHNRIVAEHTEHCLKHMLNFLKTMTGTNLKVETSFRQKLTMTMCSSGQMSLNHENSCPKSKEHSFRKIWKTPEEKQVMHSTTQVSIHTHCTRLHC
ncbi:hypothetical protein AMECASPLE_008607 [Ameca splendens]|uniref:Uncharacterized protein n=1 Tax=Ameca splendens TaxID=208324 RepID=A0ABV0YMF9_9TELE